MTEDEAKTKVCCGPPHAGDVPKGQGRILCVGAACMGWRWKIGDPIPVPSDTQGYCGLAGAPQ